MNRKWVVASIILIVNLLLLSSNILAADSGSAEDYWRLGNKAYKEGKYEEALAAYDKAIAIKPDYADAWNNKGTALSDLGRKDEAIAAYDKAIAIKPDHAKAWNNKGVALKGLGRKEEAIAAYDKAIAIKPDYAEPWSNKGNALYDLGRKDEAIAAYDKAIAIKPDYAGAYYNLACSYSLKKDQAMALKYLETAIDKGYNDLKHIEEDHDLDFIRDTPEYRQIVEKLKGKG